jgi:AcrR family transcriptional regulator
MNKLHSLRAVAVACGISYPTVWRHFEAGNLKAEMVGSIRIVDDVELERFKAWYAVHGGRWGAK